MSDAPLTVPTVNEHLKGIFADGELATTATIRKFQIVRLEGRREVPRDIEPYNLEKATKDLKKLPKPPKPRKANP